MAKTLEEEMQATLRTLQLVGSVIECDAGQCHGDAKGELLLLIRKLRSDDAGFGLADRAAIADQAQAALEVHDARKRIWHMARLHVALWQRVTDFLDA